MSKYRITLEGKNYEMEIELVASNGVAQPAAKREASETRKVSESPAAPATKPAAREQAAGESGCVKAPMPGTVIRIEKGEGSAVKAGEVVLVLEAMKMENEITAPANGSITLLNCKVGGTVAGGDVLFEVK